jgi:hypothetical protein
MPLQTRIDSLSERMRGIRFTSSEKTFKELVLVVRMIGIRYLWIDTLCIVQDDVVDWSIESAKISDIYRNASITLVAAAAKNNTEGL